MATRGTVHTTRFPGETDDYRSARDSLLQAEVDLRRQIERVAEQRRRLPLGGEIPTDYVFDAWMPGASEVTQTRMSQLFAPGKQTLFLYNFMFPERPDSMTPCPSCTSIIDAVDGAARHLTQRINFAVVAKAPIEKLREHGRNRGWRHSPLLSSAGNDFNRDYHADEDGQQWPLAHVFVRRDGKVRHFWTSELWFTEADASGQGRRHVDFMWPLWSILDRTPEGRGEDWGPELEYS